MKSKHHKDMMKACSSNLLTRSFIKPGISNSTFHFFNGMLNVYSQNSGGQSKFLGMWSNFPGVWSKFWGVLIVPVAILEKLASM